MIFVAEYHAFPPVVDYGIDGLVLLGAGLAALAGFGVIPMHAKVEADRQAVEKGKKWMRLWGRYCLPLLLANWFWT